LNIELLRTKTKYLQNETTNALKRLEETLEERNVRHQHYVKLLIDTTKNSKMVNIMETAAVVLGMIAKSFCQEKQISIVDLSLDRNEFMDIVSRTTGVSVRRPS